MSDREKETIQQVILPDFGPSSLPKPPAPSGPDPSTLVDQVSDRVTFGSGARTGSMPTPNRPPASARDPLRSKQNPTDTETVEDQDSPLSTLNFPTVADLEKCLSPINKQPSKPHIYRILLAIAIVVIVIVASLIAFNRAWHSRHQTPKALNVPQKTTPALPPEPVGKPLQLPSFVPTASLDAAYTRANPGWERYLTADTEFRVFREGSAIRALQAIDLTGKGIPEVFANKALAEVADLTEAVPRTTERKGSYIIERSQPSPVTRAVLYRKDPSRQIKAFVVYFD